VLKETRTLSATYTFQAYVRVPVGESKVIAVHAPDAWSDDQEIKAIVAGFDAPCTAVAPSREAAGQRYGKVFEANAGVDVVIHVHGPHLGAWAGSHRVLPLRYAPAQRHTLAREIRFTSIGAAAKPTSSTRPSVVMPTRRPSSRQRGAPPSGQETSSMSPSTS